MLRQHAWYTRIRCCYSRQVHMLESKISKKGGMCMHHHTFKNLIAGFLIGVGCILPGVSGGVMAVSFGLYRPMLDSLLHFWDKPKERLFFLFPLAVGGAAGMLMGAGVLASLMAQHRQMMLLLFTGLILGGLPELWQEAQQSEPFRPRWLLALAAGIGLALPLVWLGAKTASVSQLSGMQCLLTGLLEGVGTVIPGISTSFVLIRLGWYTAYLQALSGMAFAQVVPIAAGFAVSAFLCMKAVVFLFDRATGYAYLGVMGFLLVSVLLVFPGFHTGRLFWADIGLMLTGILAARQFARSQLQKR